MGLYLTTPQFAKQVGVSKNTIINWERQGLILPHHVSPTGRRFYSQAQVDDILKGKLDGVELSKGAKPVGVDDSHPLQGGVPPGDGNEAPDG